MNALKALADYLRQQKYRIVRSENLLVENWSPTYGAGEPNVMTVDVIDFDALLSAIDDFASTFERKE